MDMRSVMCSTAAVLALSASGVACAQGAPKPGMSEQDLRNHLIWNSPWEGRSSLLPPGYSYRTVFRARREVLIAEVVSYTTNQKADSVVSLSGGAVSWQDSGGAEINVLMAESGDLVGTARSRDTSLPIVLKPRP